MLDLLPSSTLRFALLCLWFTNSSDLSFILHALPLFSLMRWSLLSFGPVHFFFSSFFSGFRFGLCYACKIQLSLLFWLCVMPANYSCCCCSNSRTVLCFGCCDSVLCSYITVESEMHRVYVYLLCWIQIQTKREKRRELWMFMIR